MAADNTLAFRYAFLFPRAKLHEFLEAIKP